MKKKSLLSIFFLYSLLLLVFLPFDSYALFDSIVDAAKDVAEASALVDATHELLKTVDNDPSNESLKSLDQSLANLSKELERLNQSGKESLWIKSETEELLKIPQMSHQTLTESIRTSSQYLRRLKRLLAAIAAFPKAAGAYAQSETVFALHEELRLQRSSLAIQTQILSELQFARKKEEIESRSFDELMNQEFKKRRGTLPRGVTP